MLEKIRKTIKTKLLDSSTGTLTFYQIRVLREKWAMLTQSDYGYIKKQYRKRYGKEINLKNPQTISEKLQWLKLFYRNDQMPICSDKYDLRLYLKKHGVEYLLNEVIAVYESDQEIDRMDIKTLPKSFVAKATHGSSWNLIVKDKNEIDWELWKKIFKQWLKLDLSVFGREWNYREVKPRILIEEFLDHKPLIDYKITCFNGSPKYFQINSEKNGKRYVDFYDETWSKLGISLKGYNPSEDLISPPPDLDKLLEIARILSKEFPFVRVDFYNFDGRIIIGELTFFPGGGLLAFYPETNRYENLFGSYLNLPEPNYNLDLFKKIQSQ